MHINNLLLFSHLSHVPLLATPWTTIPLSSTISWSLLRFMSIELVMLSNHLILCHPFSFCLQSFPASRSFPISLLFASGGQSIGASAATRVLPMTSQGWFPLGLTGLISLLAKRLSRVFSSITIRKHQIFKHSAFFMVQLSHLYMSTETQTRFQPGGVGWGERWDGVQEGGDKCIPTADSCWGLTENKIL